MKWTKALCTMSLGFVILLGGKVPQAGAAIDLCSSNLLLNSGFEYRHNGAWEESPWNRVITESPADAYRGSWLAVLKSEANSQSRLRQVVSIPQDIWNAQLSFFLKIKTMDSLSTVYDKLLVKIAVYVPGEEFPAYTLLRTYSNKDALTFSSYQQTPWFDITSFKGKKVVISFEQYEDINRPTTFEIDNVALTITPKFDPFCPRSPLP